jgi:hypothetical protein
MSFQDTAPDWHAIWADLLKGAGAGLLEYDGSPAARAALAGLAVFDKAQERRRRDASGEPEDPEDLDPRAEEFDIWPELSEVERAHFLALSPEERQAYRDELAQADGRAAVSAALLRHLPMSPNPLAGWRLGARLPLAPDGGLNIPSFRR